MLQQGKTQVLDKDLVVFGLDVCSLSQVTGPLQEWSRTLYHSGRTHHALFSGGTVKGQHSTGSSRLFELTNSWSLDGI